MRTLPLLVLFLLPACAPTTDELFIKANISGDWTAVNARLEAEDEPQPANCRSGSVPVCETSHVETCTCVQSAQFFDRFRESHTQRRYNH
jgi:hypothetical protein